MQAMSATSVPTPWPIAAPTPSRRNKVADLSKRIVYTLVPLLALVGLGAYAYFAQRSEPARLVARDNGSTAPATATAAALPVEVVKVRIGKVQDDLTAVGSLLSNESVMLRPEVAGRVMKLPFPESSPVKKGSVLVVLDASTQQAELAQASAQLALNRANYERAEELLKKSFISGKARDEALAALRINEANVQLLEARLAKTRIVAPFDATTGMRRVAVGDYVKEGQDLMGLEDLSALKVDFRVPEHVAGRVRLGQNVELTADAAPGRTFVARIVTIDPVVDQAGRALGVRARMDNPPGTLRPGMFARVRLILAERSSALIPEEALVPGGAEQYVFRIVEGKAERVQVITGVRRDAMVEILQGLGRDDTVVKAGQMRLRDGSPVRISPEEGETPPGAPSVPPQAQGSGPGAS
jgi:membrane fusion protein, multidrug efflux system